MTKLGLSLLLLLGTLDATAADITITGRVIDEKGNAMAGEDRGKLEGQVFRSSRERALCGGMTFVDRKSLAPLLLYPR